MPLETKVIDIDEEIASMEAEREGLADDVAEYGYDTDAAKQTIEKGNRIDRFLSGLYWYRETYDQNTLIIGALTSGERHLVNILTDGSQDASEAMHQHSYIAVGTRDAPYLEHDPEAVTTPAERSSIRETIGNIAPMHPAFTDWIQYEISNLGGLDGDMGKSFRTLVLEKRVQEASTGTSG